MPVFINEWYIKWTLLAVDLAALALAISFSYRWMFKRILDCIISALCMLFLAPMYAIIFIYAGIEKKKGRLEKIFSHSEFVGLSEKNIKLIQLNKTDKNGKMHAYGQWLEKTKLYKLANVFNWFLGRLSLVGVQPFLESDCVFLSEEEEVRMQVRPGLINPLVLNGNAKTDYDEMLAQDAWYVKKFRFRVDCKIFFVWLLKQIRGEGNTHLGKTRESTYAKALLDEQRITQADYEEALNSVKQ
jgi:lipopolysaccharide/colanic/teichoic acid biosynthesis glycosyltransferase